MEAVGMIEIWYPKSSMVTALAVQR